MGHYSRTHCFCLPLLSWVRSVLLGTAAHKVPGSEVAEGEAAARSPLVWAFPIQCGPGAIIHLVEPFTWLGILYCGRPLRGYSFSCRTAPRCLEAPSLGSLSMRPSGRLRRRVCQGSGPDQWYIRRRWEVPHSCHGKLHVWHVCYLHVLWPLGTNDKATCSCKE